MRYYVDDLIRLIDSIDLNVYENLVIASDYEDYTMFKEILGDSKSFYIIMDGVKEVGGHALSLDIPGVGGLWFNISTDAVKDYINKLKSYVIYEIKCLYISTRLNPLKLLLAYEVIKDLKSINSNNTALLLIRVPEVLSDDDGVNLVTYLAKLIDSELADAVLLVSNKLVNYLKLIKDPEASFTTCIKLVLENVGEVAKYLRVNNRLGAITCFPKADLNVFASLINVLRLAHHLSGDLSERVGRALLILVHDVSEFNLMLNSVREYFKIEELRYIEVRGVGGYVTLVSIEPRSSLLSDTILKYVVKAYNIVRELGVGINISKLVRLISQEVS